MYVLILTIVVTTVFDAKNR